MHGRQHDEHQRGHPIGDAEHHVLARVGVRQRVVTRPEKQGEQHHTGRGAEVAAVYRDQEDRGGFQVHSRRMPLVARDPGYLFCPAWQQDGERRDAEQNRHDALETLCGREQQQRGARGAAERRGGDDLPDPDSPSGKFGPRSPYRTDAVEHQSDGVGHVRGHRWQPDEQQCRIGGDGRQARDAARQSARQTRSEQDGGVKPTHGGQRYFVGNTSATEVLCGT